MEGDLDYKATVEVVAQAVDWNEQHAQQISRRDETTSELFENLKNSLVVQLKTKEDLKKSFYRKTMLLLQVVLVVCGIAVIVLAFSPSKNITAFVSAVVGGISALLVLPKIIANYLFNPEEAKEIAGIMKEIFTKDIHNPDKP